MLSIRLKRKLVGSFSLFSIGYGVMNAQEHFNILEADREPSQPLLELLAILRVQHDGSLASIVSQTQ